MLNAIKSNLLHNVDCDLRVIILSANGGVFSSGHDLKELVSLGNSPRTPFTALQITGGHRTMTDHNLPMSDKNYPNCGRT